MEQETDNSSHTQVSRRHLLKMALAVGGATAASTLLPGKWVKPEVTVGVLPAFAKTSGYQCVDMPPSAWTLLDNATVDGEWIQLTTAATMQRGGALCPEAFATAAGISVTFEYATHDGIGTGADGFCIFFSDGAYGLPTLGPPGGALGYNTDGADPGLSHAYLGIGFDEYGNFSPSPGVSQSIVLRGSGNGTTGYNYLTGVDVFTLYGMPIGGVTRAAARQVECSLFDNLVTVRVKFGSDWRTVISNYDLNAASGQAALPSSLRVGFAASTGESTNYHEIRNFSICSA